MHISAYRFGLHNPYCRQFCRPLRSKHDLVLRVTQIAQAQNEAFVKYFKFVKNKAL
jgi:hypothetical protein